jgi:hypothetical protein
MRSIAIALALLSGTTYVQSQAWQPPTIRWYCAPNGVQQLCSLEAIGDPPASLPVNPVATGYYRVLKGRTAGQGTPLMTAPFEMPCALLGPFLRCYGENLLRLCANVRTSIDYTIAPTTAINIYIDTPSKLFDWDGDGAITADKEGVMLLRALLGFRGNAITQGIALAGGRTAESVEQAVIVGVWNGWFQFIAPNEVPLALREGVLFQRCVSGLRGAALTAGVTTQAAAGIEAQCDKLLAIE